MKKEVKYSSPKRFQKGWEEKPTFPAKPPKPRSKYCKKLKGDHIYKISEKDGGFYDISWKTPKVRIYVDRYLCVGCNRKDVRCREEIL